MQENCYLNTVVFALGEERCLIRAMLVIAEPAAWHPLQRLPPFVVEEPLHGKCNKGDTERRTDHRTSMSGVGGTIDI
jgi:hypothetical protein